MAGAFVSGSVVAPGGSYAPASGTDTELVWVAAARTTGTNSASGQTFGATSMNEPANQDQTIDISGGGDPTGVLQELVNPGTTSQTLNLTWANTILNDLGYAFTLSGIDQTTPLYGTNGQNGGTYTSNASPSLSYDVPAGGVVVYWRVHAQSSDPSWTDPTNFTRRDEQDLLTSPAYRTMIVWTREVASAEVGSTVSATSDLSGDGVHGVCVFQQSSAAGGIEILRRRIEG